ncbi:MAG: PEP/pyruvate-binding domain-containing protein, partial [Candidatus Cloacimonetes bacterium]|nr:PEP/pyruvate-binding domain-containing protein [Candidatus Cloacimonadota bacterium]
MNETDQIIRLADGSLGGKGRALAFINALLVASDINAHFKHIEVLLPSTAVIGTYEYVRFMEMNGNPDLRHGNRQIINHFLKGLLSPELLTKLRMYLEQVRKPLAVRSSGLLEDSTSQPMAGIYSTHLRANTHPDREIRLQQLCDAIKMVFASMHFRESRRYLQNIQFNPEEERMAVLIQEIAGAVHNGYFYPHFTGVAQSYNAHPRGYLKSDDTIAWMCFGLGKGLDNHESVFLFSPNYPSMNLNDEVVNQKEFFAVSLKSGMETLASVNQSDATRLPILHAMDESCLKQFFKQDEQIGENILDISAILTDKRFLIPRVINEILDMGQTAIGKPVEIEFAMQFEKRGEELHCLFYVLQLRPIAVQIEGVVIKPEKTEHDKLLLMSRRCRGSGRYMGIRDILWFRQDSFETAEVPEIIEALRLQNRKMEQEERPYLLVAPCKWGSRNPYTGIPIKWTDISCAKVLVEISESAGTSSLLRGTHFLTNLNALNIGYIMVSNKDAEEYFNREWFTNRQTDMVSRYFAHIRLEEPLTIEMDARNGVAVIYKPE